MNPVPAAARWVSLFLTWGCTAKTQGCIMYSVENSFHRPKQLLRSRLRLGFCIPPLSSTINRVLLYGKGSLRCSGTCFLSFLLMQSLVVPTAEDLYVVQGKGSYASPVQLFLPFCHMSQSHKASSKPDSVGFHIESLLSTIWG